MLSTRIKNKYLKLNSILFIYHLSKTFQSTRILYISKPSFNYIFDHQLLIAIIPNIYYPEALENIFPRRF